MLYRSIGYKNKKSSKEAAIYDERSIKSKLSLPLEGKKASILTFFFSRASPKIPFRPFF